MKTESQGIVFVRIVALLCGCLFSERWKRHYSKEFAFPKFNRDDIEKTLAFEPEVFPHYIAPNRDVKYETCSAKPKMYIKREISYWTLKHKILGG